MINFTYLNMYFLNVLELCVFESASKMYILIINLFNIGHFTYFVNSHL